MTQELGRNRCIHERPQKFFQGWQHRNSTYPFQVVDDAMQMDVHKPLPFLSHWSVLVDPQFSIFCLKCFLHFSYQKCFFFS